MMPSAASDAAVASPHPLIAQLFTKHGFTAITAENLDAFVAAPGHALLMFTEDPLRVKETLDLAVIVPELARTFAGRFRVGVLLPEAARQLHPCYGLLEALPTRPPTIGIPVTTVSGERHCGS